ncbi:MAG: sortase [Anaerolineae bacterium]|nr:sortase [Anaerolineae bacterium]
MNLRWIGYLILAGLFLVIVGVGCVSPSEPVSDGDQPARLASPTVSSVPLATRMPQALAPTPTATGMAADTSRGLITEPSDGAQPQNDRTPTRMAIPAIGLDAPVEPVGWQAETQNGQFANVMDAPNHFAAGWLKTSAPLGVTGNTVLDGHHNIYGEVFKDLVNVQVGDTITLYATGQERTYRVDQKLILAEAEQPLKVRQANALYIAPTMDERLTLVTCWPPNGNSHRLIIVALPVSSSPGLPGS